MADQTLARPAIEGDGCQGLLIEASAQIVEIANAVQRMYPLSDMDPKNTVVHALMCRVAQLADAVVEAIDPAYEKDVDAIRRAVLGVSHG